MKRTPLFQEHLELGARMTAFAGYEMPLQYSSGINQEHLAVRNQAGIFDVSHMGQIRVLGDDVLAFLRFALLNDAGKLKPQRAHYTMLANAQGGLVDDLYLYNEDGKEYMIVCNAANRSAVVELLKDIAQDYDVFVVDESENWALIALQGPAAAVLLNRHTSDDISDMRKNSSRTSKISGCGVKLTRTGYTGEDGFEIFCHPTDAAIIWKLLVTSGATACGLGARDTLRLEAGFPLYGHEFTPSTNPLCSDYAWVIKDKAFYGREMMWEARCEYRLAGLMLTSRGIAREGYKLFYQQEHIGKVTSGTLSPLTRQSIALAWIKADYAHEGQALSVEIRGQQTPATIVKTPFF